MKCNMPSSVRTCSQREIQIEDMQAHATIPDSLGKFQPNALLCIHLDKLFIQPQSNIVNIVKIYIFFVHAHLCMDACMDAYLDVCLYVCLNVYRFVCMYACMYAFM